MATEYSRSLLRVALAQICQNLGWSSVYSTPLEILTDVLERYLTGLGVFTHRYAEQFGRVNPTLDDLGLAFQEMGVNLAEVGDYMKHVEQIPFAFDVPRYPVQRPNLLNFPKPNSREVYEREEHVPDYMPTMHPGWEDEILHDVTGDGEETSNIDGRGDGSTSEKRSATTPLDSEPAAKRARTSKILPEEALPSSYEMKGVSMSHKGLPVGCGKLPDSAAPPPQTPTTNTIHNPLFKTPSLPEESPKAVIKENTPSLTNDSEEISSVASETVNVETKTEPVNDSIQKKSHRGRPPKSPKSSTAPIASTPKSSLDKEKKHAKLTPNPEASPIIKRPPGRPPKSPKGVGRPKKSPGRPPKSPAVAGQPPKSPIQSTGRSPGRPPKSPGRPPKSPGRTASPRSPIRSPLSSPLSPRSPGSAKGRGRSPGRPPKSPGRGRGRPPKSPRLPDSPIREYLRTGELSGIGGVPTKAQLKMPPVTSPTRGRKPSDKSAKRSDSMQKLDFEKPAPPGVISETIEVNTFTEKLPSPPKPQPEKPKPQPEKPKPQPEKPKPQPEKPKPQPEKPKPQPEKLKKPPWNISEAIQEVLKSKELVDADDEMPDEENSKDTTDADATTKRQREREEQLRQEILKNEPQASKETKEEKAEPKITEEREKKEEKEKTRESGRVTPDWIRKQAEQMTKEVKLKEERKAKPEESRPLTPLSDVTKQQKPTDSPKPDKERIKSKKEKKKKKHRDENAAGDGGGGGGTSTSKQSKKEKRFEEKLRERLRESSLSSSSPERPLPVVPEKGGGEAKQSSAIQPLRIGFGNQQFTIKSMPEDSDKETKKKKKSKKHKEKDKDKDNGRDEGREKKEKKKDKKKDKEKSKKKEEPSEQATEPQLKLKFTMGGKGMTVTPTDSPRDSPKRDIPKLVIKNREETNVLSKLAGDTASSRSSSASPTRRYSPPPLFGRSPSPVPIRDAARISPIRFTPSPESNPPKTPSMNASPANSRVSSPSLRNSSVEYKPARGSSRERSMSPIKTPTLSRHSPSPPPSASSRRPDRVSRSPSLPPPPPSTSSKGSASKSADAAQTKKGKMAGAEKTDTQVISETQGTIIGENGEIIWICPACALADDGSPMIGCDTCDDWYHWACMGITEEPPDDESWFCPKHRSKDTPKRTPKGWGRGRGRKKSR